MLIGPKCPTLSIVTIVAVFSITVSFMCPVKGGTEVRLLSHTGYLDSSGYYHVVGEVQNVGDNVVTFVAIFITFYESNGALVDSRFDLTMLNVILIGRKSPFDIALLDAMQSAKVDHYSVNMTFSTGSSIPTGLEIQSPNSQVDNGRLRIVGRIKNIGSETAQNVKIIATCYDEGGVVVAAEYTWLDPIERDLDSGLTASFEILLTEDRTPFVNTFELTSESVQYAAIDEFPSWAFMLVLLTSMSAFLIRKRKK
jgi:hypothetical protein